MPGMSEQEAKKMVSQLDRQLKQAEKAAQRTGKNTARGMREVDRATKIATNSMRQFRTAGRNADRIFGELSTGLELVSPELGAMAGFASQASSGIEALGRAIGGANPMLLAITVAAAGAALAYQFFSVDAKEVEEQAKKTTEKLKELADATAGIEGSANQARLELGVLKGEISALDAEILQNEFDI
jgi:septal ring factor EnvC (AmiA/AmiB activator)